MTALVADAPWPPSRPSETTKRSEVSLSLKLISPCLLMIIAVAGCGSTSPAKPAGSASPSAVISRAAVDAEVISAWTAEQQAFVTAVRQMNPDLPALAQTATDPQLSGIRVFISTSRAAGDVARGTESPDNPRVVALEPWPDPTRATVSACIHDGLLLYSRRTGKPVAGLSGRITWDRETTQLTNRAGLGWVVASNIVHEGLTESICAGA